MNSTDEDFMKMTISDTTIDVFRIWWIDGMIADSFHQKRSPLCYHDWLGCTILDTGMLTQNDKVDITRSKIDRLNFETYRLPDMEIVNNNDEFIKAEKKLQIKPGYRSSSISRNSRSKRKRADRQSWKAKAHLLHLSFLLKLSWFELCQDKWQMETSELYRW